MERHTLTVIQTGETYSSGEEALSALYRNCPNGNLVESIYQQSLTDGIVLSITPTWDQTTQTLTVEKIYADSFFQIIPLFENKGLLITDWKQSMIECGYLVEATVTPT